MHRVSIFIVLLTVVLFASPAFSDSTAIWEKHIQTLKERYGSKFEEGNVILMAYRWSEPCPEYGSTCRKAIKTDKARIERRDEIARLKKKGLKPYSRLEMSTPYWHTKDPFKKDAPQIANILSDKEAKLINKLLDACEQWNYCQNKGTEQMAISFHRQELYMRIQIPHADEEDQNGKVESYLVLLTPEQVRQLDSIE